jgi:hypothetical protein
MTAGEYDAMDGLRYEVFLWTRFRLRVSRNPQGGGSAGWHYECRDSLYRDDGTGEPAVVRSGDRPTWDAALEAGRTAHLDARWTALVKGAPGRAELSAARPSLTPAPASPCRQSEGEYP